MSSQWIIEGHAIVSKEGCIADHERRFPPGLGNVVDWVRFQSALDRCEAVVLGRASHERTPNPSGRLRVILSHGVASGLERRDDGWWWRPDATPVEEMLATVAPEGGLIGIAGGCGAFDLFLAHGYDAFRLARNARCSLPGGQPVFSAVRNGRTPEALLAEAGLSSGCSEVLDAEAGVSTTVWRSGAAAAAAE